MKSTAIVNSTSDSPTCGTKPPPKLRVLKDYSVEVVVVPVERYDRELVTIFAEHFVRELRNNKKIDGNSQG